MYAYWITVNYRESYGMYACNGILFNHESPRRGETFVTRKITRAIANISQGIENVSILAIWIHCATGAYERLRAYAVDDDLQQDHPEDFVIATGKQISIT